MYTSALRVGSGGSWLNMISMSELLNTHCSESKAMPDSSDWMRSGRSSMMVLYLRK